MKVKNLIIFLVLFLMTFFQNMTFIFAKKFKQTSSRSSLFEFFCNHESHVLNNSVVVDTR